MASAPPMEDEQSVIRCPDIPFVSAIVGGLFPGRSIVVSGMIVSGESKRFNLDLCCGLLINGDHMDNKALHFNPRFEKNSGWFSGSGDHQLVLNSYVSNRWGEEDRYENPFEEGKPFQIRIMVFDKYFKIAVNGRHLCDFAHRVPVETVKTILINGGVRLDYVEFQPAIRLDSSGQPLVTTPAPAKEEKITTIDRPTLPFVWPVPEGGFVSPQTLRFTLTPFVSGKKFTINLKSKGEHMFHFDVRIDVGKEKAIVVRNSTKDGKWLTEERDGKFPFHRGITHDVVFHAYGRSVAVDVDGTPFVKFSYRTGDDPVTIDRVTAEGDIVLQRVVHKGLQQE